MVWSYHILAEYFNYVYFPVGYTLQDDVSETIHKNWQTAYYIELFLKFVLSLMKQNWLKAKENSP